LSPHLAERLVSIHRQQNGAVIRTSIDASTQQRLDILARDHAKRISDQANVAMIVVESATGAVRAHIGSAGYYETLRQGSVDMTEATRSPGSTLKPFLYAMAFDEDLAAPNTIILDAPTRFGAYAPNNFNAGFAGEISLSAALQHSLNVSSVKLLDAIGPERFAAKLRNSGLHLFFGPGGRPNLTMILGGVGVTLEDLARGYLQLTSFQGPRDLHFVTPGSSPLRQPFAREETLWAISNILREAPAPPGFAIAERVQDFAIKTGTSYGYRDAWAVGWNEDYVVAIWVGRADGAPLPTNLGGPPPLRSSTRFIRSCQVQSNALRRCALPPILWCDAIMLTCLRHCKSGWAIARYWRNREKIRRLKSFIHFSRRKSIYPAMTAF
jgi:Membrane carboxypeptidase/penicillin-binding protein PbpC